MGNARVSLYYAHVRHSPAPVPRAGGSNSTKTYVNVLEKVGDIADRGSSPNLAGIHSEHIGTKCNGVLISEIPR